MATNIDKILSDLKRYCSEKNLLIFPGRVFSTDLADCTWEGKEEDDWRTFLEIAQKCGISILHLDVDVFDYDAEEIDNLADTLPDDEDLSIERIRQAKASKGKSYAFELSFLHNAVLYKYEAENELAEVARMLLDAEDNSEDNLQDQAESVESENRRQEIDALVEEVLSHPEYREKMKYPDRYRFILSYVQNHKGQSSDIAFFVSRIAERQYQERILPIVKDELEKKLADLRKKEPKLTKLKAQSILGITKTDLDAIWYKEEKTSPNSLFDN